MQNMRDYYTIPELFEYNVKKGLPLNKPAFKYKSNGKYNDISYSEFKTETEKFAFGLTCLDLKKGDKIAIISENRPEWVYSDMAILGLGAVDVPLYPILTAENIEFILNDSESKGIIVSNNFQLNKILKIRENCKHLKFIIVLNEIDTADKKNVFTFNEVKKLGEKCEVEHYGLLDERRGLISEDDVCTIIYTSGTTGVPKGVVLTHKNIISNVKAANKVFNFSENDVFLSFLPLCHIFERMAGYYTALSGMCTIAYAEGIEKVATNLIEIRPTIMTAVPRFFERLYSKIKRNIESQPPKKQKIFNWAVKIGVEYKKLVAEQEKVPLKLKMEYKLAQKLVYSKLAEKTGGRLRFFISGGAALSRELGEFFDAIGITVLEGYGLTESSPVIACNRLNDYKFGTVGKPFPGVEVKIAKDGEILAAGPSIMQGYYKNKKETDAVLKNGWLHTGDIGVFDAEGFLIITDRKKHLFKTSGGKYIAPTPIENMFLANKYIDQFVVIGDKRMFLTALIVPDFEALKEYADANRIHYDDIEDLVKLKQIDELIDKEFSVLQKKLANYEKIRKFTLLEKPFSIEDGELTPSLKIKRKVIEQRYGNLIDEMYKKIDA